MAEKIRLSSAIDAYMNFRRHEGISRNTAKNERLVLDRLLKVAGNIYLVNIGDSHLTAYAQDASQSRSPRTMGIDYACLNRFFQWAATARHISRMNNPMEGRRRPRWMPTDRRHLPMGDFPRLLDAAGAAHPRDRMVVALGIYLFLRASEIVDLRIGDIDLNAGVAYVRIFKTRQVDQMPICAELDNELRRWLVYYSEEQGQLHHDWYLVPAKRKHNAAPLGEGGKLVSLGFARLVPNRKIVKVESIAQRALEAIGFPVRGEDGVSLREGIHTLRRSGGRARYEVLRQMGHDGSVRQVQAMLHHKNLSQTEEYLGISLERQQRNELTRGQPMFPRGENVVELKRAADGGD